jgi:hypothetical protein
MGEGRHWLLAHRERDLVVARWCSGGQRAAPVTQEAASRPREPPQPTHKGRQSVVRAGDGDVLSKTEE